MSETTEIIEMITRIKDILDEMEELLPQLETTVPYKTVSCLDCDCWNISNDICNKFNSKPPATVIVKTCPEFLIDIPF